MFGYSPSPTPPPSVSIRIRARSEWKKGTAASTGGRRPTPLRYGYEAAGQGGGFVKEMKPARQIVSDMGEEALGVFDDIVGLPD